MRAVILFGGDISDYTYMRTFLHGDEAVICADSGYRHAEMLRIAPSVLLGDMDSIKRVPNGIQKRIYPVRKDETDGELAVKYVIEQGFSEVLLFGCIGSRADHTLTNIFLMRQLIRAGIDAVLINETNEIRMAEHMSVELTGEIGTVVSIIPLMESVHIRHTEGLSYAAENLVLTFGTSLGNSNYMIDTRCRIDIGSGLCLIIKSRD